MEKHFRYIIIWILFSSCNQIIDKPDELLSEEQTSEVLYQIFLHRNHLIIVDKDSKTNNSDVNKFVLKHLEIDPLSFEKSIAYYTLNPKIHRRILEKVQYKFDSLATTESIPSSNE